MLASAVVVIAFSDLKVLRERSGGRNVFAGRREKQSRSGLCLRLALETCAGSLSTLGMTPSRSVYCLPQTPQNSQNTHRKLAWPSGGKALGLPNVHIPEARGRSDSQSLCSPLDLQSKNKGREIIPTFVRVNRRREVN